MKREGIHDEDECDIGGVLPPPSKSTKDLHAVIKSACTNKRYQEAVRLCTEALQDKSLSKASQVQLLLSRSSAYSKLNESGILALKDAKNAIVIAPTSPLAYVRAAKALHQAGHKAKARQALKMASELEEAAIRKNGARKSELKQLIDDLGKKWNSPWINYLPEETLVEVFSHLSLRELGSCMAICRRWKNTALGNQSLWRNHVTLQGSMKEIDAKWNKLCKLAGGPKIRSMSLSIKMPSEWCNERKLAEQYRLEAQKIWSQSALARNFPSDTLVYFEYVGHSSTRPVDSLVWNTLSSCQKLKSLHWNSKITTGAHYRLDKTPMERCRLEDFRLSLSGHCRLDQSFVALLGEAKLLHLNAYLDKQIVRAILKAAKDTCKELHIVGVNSGPIGSVVEKEESSSIEMKRLEIFHAHLSSTLLQPAVYNLIAPQAVDVRFHGEGMSDHTLLASCMDNLETLHYMSEDDLVPKFYQGKPFILPRLSNLSIQSLNGIDVPSLWKAIMSLLPTEAKIEDEINRVIPVLSKLEIHHIEHLSGGELVRLIQSRTRLGLVPLKYLRLRRCQNIHPTSVAWLRDNVYVVAVDNN